MAKLIKSKRAMEWYVVAMLILLAVSAVFIVLYLSGAFTKLGEIGSEGLFGWLDIGK